MKKTLNIIAAIFLGLFTANGLTVWFLSIYAEYWYSEANAGLMNNYVFPIKMTVLWVIFSFIYWKLIKYYKNPSGK